MTAISPTCRRCAIRVISQSVGPTRLPLRRTFSALSPPQPESTPFFTPPYRPSAPASYSRKGKERATGGGNIPDDEDPELEVGDKEWEMRAGTSTSLDMINGVRGLIWLS